MKFAITKTSNEEYLAFKEFNSLEDLLKFQKKSTHLLLIKDYYVDKNGRCVNMPSVEIYDGYRE